MDKTDMKLLAAMEKNSRVSLKTLARDFSVKTSTIYHRLHKLRESGILERFTIVVNPEKIGLSIHCLINIRLKKMVIGKLDSMFLESFAKFLADQYEEILFTSVGDDEQIHVIATFRDESHRSEFQNKVKENPYIDSINCVHFNKILKGQKLFQFMPTIVAQSQVGEYFDDSDEDETETEDDDENDEDSTTEIEF